MSDETQGRTMTIQRMLAILQLSESEAGPACINVDVPPTLVMDESFREAYCQGYRHAVADVRRALSTGGTDAD